jgi:hypothetical protein
VFLGEWTFQKERGGEGKKVRSQRVKRAESREVEKPEEGKY